MEVNFRNHEKNYPVFPVHLTVLIITVISVWRHCCTLAQIAKGISLMKWLRTLKLNSTTSSCFHLFSSQNYYFKQCDRQTTWNDFNKRKSIQNCWNMWAFKLDNQNVSFHFTLEIKDDNFSKRNTGNGQIYEDIRNLWGYRSSFLQGTLFKEFFTHRRTRAHSHTIRLHESLLLVQSILLRTVCDSYIPTIWPGWIVNDVGLFHLLSTLSTGEGRDIQTWSWGLKSDEVQGKTLQKGACESVAGVFR